MLNINLERPLVTLAVVAVLLAVAGPATAFAAPLGSTKGSLIDVTGAAMLPYVEQDNYQTGGPSDETATPALSVPGRVEYPNLTHDVAPGHERHPGDQLVFSGDAYDNEMGVIGAAVHQSTQVAVPLALDAKGFLPEVGDEILIARPGADDQLHATR
jgi:hypothetical protein